MTRIKSSVREMVLDGLGCFGIGLDRERNRAVRSTREEVRISAGDSPVRVFVIPTNEELVIAEDVAAIHSGRYHGQLHYDYSFAEPNFVPAGSLG